MVVNCRVDELNEPVTINPVADGVPSSMAVAFVANVRHVPLEFVPPLPGAVGVEELPEQAAAAPQMIMSISASSLVAMRSLSFEGH
jgi:hypothetical protein